MAQTKTPQFSIYFNNNSVPLYNAETLPYTDVILSFLVILNTDPLKIGNTGNLDNQVLSQIKAVQDRGKTVRISFGGATITSEQYATLVGRESEAAAQIADYVDEYGLDGVDLDYEDTAALQNNQPYNGAEFISNLTNALASQLPSSQNIITHAPQPPYLCAPGAPFNCVPNTPYVQVLQEAGDHINWLNMQYYNNPPWSASTANIVASYEQIVSGWEGFSGWPASKLLFGTPVTENDAGSGYYPPEVIIDQILNPLMAAYPDFGGVMGWQYASDPSGIWADSIGDALNLVNSQT